MPGMQESLGVDSTLSDGTELSLPESLEISADVKDFTMSSTFTVALNDLLDDLNLEEIGDTDALKNAVDELEDAALQLVDGSAALSDGVVTLSDSYGEFDEGIQTLKDGSMCCLAVQEICRQASQATPTVRSAADPAVSR